MRIEVFLKEIPHFAMMDAAQRLEALTSRLGDTLLTCGDGAKEQRTFFDTLKRRPR